MRYDAGAADAIASAPSGCRAPRPGWRRCARRLAATGFQPLGLWPLALLAIGLLPAADRARAEAGAARRVARLAVRLGPFHLRQRLDRDRLHLPGADAAGARLGRGAAAVALSRGLSRRSPRPGPGHRRARPAASRCCSPSPAAGRSPSGCAAGSSPAFRGIPFGVVLLGPFDRPGLAALAPWLGTYALSGLAVLIGGGLRAGAARTALACRGALAASCCASVGMYWPARARRADGHLRFTIVQPNLTAGPARRSSARLRGQLPEDWPGFASPVGPRRAGWCCGPSPASPTICARAIRKRYYNATTAFGDPAARPPADRAGDRPGQPAADRRGRPQDRRRPRGRARTTPSPRSTRRARSSAATTRPIWCLTANTCALARLLEPLGARPPGRRLDRLHSRPGPAHARPRAVGQGAACRYATRSSSRARWSTAAPAGLHLQRFERRLVRRVRPAAAPRPGAAAGDRGRPADPARDDHRDQRGDRSARGRSGSYLPLHVAGRIDGLVPPAARADAVRAPRQRAAASLGDGIPLLGAVAMRRRPVRPAPESIRASQFCRGSTSTMRTATCSRPKASPKAIPTKSPTRSPTRIVDLFLSKDPNRASPAKR